MFSRVGWGIWALVSLSIGIAVLVVALIVALS
jgi:hypothetical protein